MSEPPAYFTFLPCADRAQAMRDGTTLPAALTEGDAVSPELDGLLHIINRISCAQEAEIIWALLCRFLSSLGFDLIKYGFSPLVQGVNYGHAEDFVVLTTMPPAFTREFIERRCYADNPMMRWCAQNVGIASWGMIAQLLRDGPEEVVKAMAENLALHQKFGLNAGFSVAFPPTLALGRGAMGVAAPPGMAQAEVDDRLQRHGALIFSVCCIAHQRLSALPLRRLGRELSKRQREVLEWLALGKTASDVARIMGLARPTVEKHLRLAREALGADSTAHALAKASFANQIFAIRMQAP